MFVAGVIILELEISGGDNDAYSAANRVIIEQAKALARDTSKTTTSVAIIVWDGRPRSSSDSTQEFADLARTSGFLVKEAKTLET
jgi:hypothetical protein